MSSAPKLTRTQWLICFIASIGFAFDIYELLMLPLIVGPALQELVGAAPGTPEFNSWVGKLFYIPAIAGGLFGLLGGYLTDRLGRRRVLTWSILIYAFSAFAAGYSTSVEMLLFFRCRLVSGEPRPLECAEAGWFDPAEVAGLDLAPADAAAWSQLRELL